MLKGMNQQWRRNIKKAAKEGVVTRRVAPPTTQQLQRFHDLYVHTAERDHFTPRPLSLLPRRCSTPSDEEDPDRIALFTAEHEGDLVASTILIQVGGHVWYSYGASSTEKRDVRGSNAVQWEMIRHALAHDADVYDLRGITDTLDPDDSHVGLIQFKVGTGGEAVEYAGEWDLPVNRLLYKAFSRLHGAAGLRADAHPLRRRRPLARPPRAGGRAAPGHRPGRQGQRLRLRQRAARRGRRSSWASTPSRSGRTPRWPTSPRRSPATCWCSRPWRPFETRATYDPRLVHTVGRLEDLAALAGAARARRPAPGGPRAGHLDAPPRVHAREPARGSRATSTGVEVEGFALHLPMAARLAPRRGASG